MSETIKEQDHQGATSEWDNLGEEVPFSSGNIGSPDAEVPEDSPNAGEPWVDFPDTLEGIDESEPDIDGVPQTAWRGERYYLDNIDELGQRSLSTKGHEATHNQDGKVYLARDKKYASLYAVGTDGGTWYDDPLPVEQIPIGVVFKINNKGNHLSAEPTSPTPDDWGPFAGKHREFITDEVPAEDCEIQEVYIMDDFIANNGEGYQRSDFRRPMEVFRVKDQSEVPEIVEKVKNRMAELDTERSKR